MEQTTTEIPITDDHEAMEASLLSLKKHRDARRILLVCVLFLCFLFYVLYFLLPPFQTRSMPISGNRYLNEEEVFSLSKSLGYEPLCFLDEEGMENTLDENSNGFVIESEIQNNGFSASLTLREDHPHYQNKGEIYYSLGKEASAVKEAVKSLPLEEHSKERILASLARDEEKIPTIHGLDDSLLTQVQRKNAAEVVWRIPDDSLSWICDIQFKGENSDTFYKVADVILKDGDKNYLLSNCLFDHFQDYFSSSMLSEKVLMKIRDALKNDSRLSTIEYPFLDGEDSLSCYPFGIRYKEAEKTVEVYIPEDTSNLERSAS